MSRLLKTFLLFLLILWPGFTQYSHAQIDKVEFTIIQEIKNNPKSPFYIDFQHYPETRFNLPIGVFDSGTGGLTVLDSILKSDQFNNNTKQKGADGIVDFNLETFIYLGDDANMPYGRYGSEGKTNLLKEHIIKDVQFLLGRKYYRMPTDTAARTDKDPVKAIVIACNTATAYGFDLIEQALNEWNLDIKVIGVIEAGAKSAVESLVGQGENRVIGVLATEGTCAVNGYKKAILKHYKNRFQNKIIGVIQQAGFGLAGAIDGDLNYIDPGASIVRHNKIYHGPGLNHPRYPVHLSLWKEYNFETGNGLLIKRSPNGQIEELELNSVINYIRYYVTELVVKTAKRYPGRIVDAVILGCTHYPYYSKEIRDHLMYLRGLDKKYSKMIPGDIRLIDPSHAVAIELYRFLASLDLLAVNRKRSRFFISVPNPLLEENQIDKSGKFLYIYKYGRSINRSLEYVKRVPFSPKWINVDVFSRIKSKMPEIFKIMFN
jgi:glutamate racemase